VRWTTALVACVAAACGRISFDPLGSKDDAQPTADADIFIDGDPSIDAAPRACLTSPAYTAMGAIRYREGTPLVSWAAARAACKSEGAELWVPTSTAILNAWSGDWVGITDAGSEGTWVTVYGMPATFLPWDAAQPDGGNGENCARSTNGVMEDRDCTDLRDYVCECK